MLGRRKNQETGVGSGNDLGSRDREAKNTGNFPESGSGYPSIASKCAVLSVILIINILLIGFTCSRYHPITDSADPFASSNKNSLSLLTILEYIQSLSDYKLRWELLYKLFLPIPQWQRQELAQLYCEKVFNI